MRRPGAATSFVNTSWPQRLGLVVLGVIVGLLVLEAGLRLGGWLFLAKKEAQNRLPADKNQFYRILCLGESTTATIPRSDECWPELTEKLLNQRSPSLRFRVFNEGVPGTNLKAILTRLPEIMGQYSPHLVIAMVGINDHRGDVLPRSALEIRLQTLRQLKVIKLGMLLWRHLSAHFVQDHPNPAPPAKTSNATLHSPFATMVQLSLVWPPTALAAEEKEDAWQRAQRYWKAGQEFRTKNQMAQALEAFRKAIEIQPGLLEAYREIAWYYLDDNRFEEAVAVYHSYIAAMPLKSEGYLELAQLYHDRAVKLREAEPATAQEALDQAAELLEKAANVDPYDGAAQLEWAKFLYFVQKDTAKALRVAKKSLIQDPPGKVQLLLFAATIYHDLGRLSEAELYVRQALYVRPDDEIGLMTLGKYYLESGEQDRAKSCFERLNVIRQRYYYGDLRAQFQSLYQTVANYQSKLALMQYPVRDIKELQLYFQHDEPILYISNQENFRAALATSNYDELFMDRFGGDFGHATTKGNMLIAENVTAAVLDYLTITPTVGNAAVKQ